MRVTVHALDERPRKAWGRVCKQEVRVTWGPTNSGFLSTTKDPSLRTKHHISVHFEMRVSIALRSAAKASNSRLRYSVGLSYASKSSPPFVPPDAKPEVYGFASQPNKLGRWVDSMLLLRAGRGELADGIEGGWTEDVQLKTRAWGAGEDFFGLVEGGGYVS